MIKSKIRIYEQTFITHIVFKIKLQLANLRILAKYSDAKDHTSRPVF